MTQKGMTYNDQLTDNFFIYSSLLVSDDFEKNVQKSTHPAAEQISFSFLNLPDKIAADVFYFLSALRSRSRNNFLAGTETL
jgi:hypothetical protein